MSDDPILSVRGLSKSFGGVQALVDVSFDLAPGDVLGIIGPNGSGKTTLVNCITGFVRPSSGSVRFLGREIAGMAPHRVAAMGLMRTFQTLRPFHGLAAFENLTVALTSPRARRLGGWQGGGRHGDRDAVAMDILEELGFERDSKIPRQLAGTLPTGYLKRLELGRCIALRPDLIVCDEVFSGLSESEIASMIPVIERLRDNGVTLIAVEHRLRALLRVASRAIALRGGAKVAEGEPRAVIDHPDVREAYLGPEEALP